MKILLVEDHADSRRNLQRLIERRGHEVIAVATAEEAQAALQTQSFPFLILDWMLPGKSGIELCRELRAAERGDEMFILLVTARGDMEDLQQALEAGANDYLSKPLDLGLLNVRLSVAERQIRDLTERNQARVALQESARQIKSVLENTSDGYFAIDRNWIFTYLNPEAEVLMKRGREELYGRNIWDVFPQAIGSAFETNYRRAMEKGEVVEFEASTSDGKRSFEVHAYPSEVGISVFFRDVTERRRIEDERLTTGKMESLGTLAGGIAHDLNNILTVISGNIGLAQIEAPNECGKLLTFLNKAGQAAQHAAHISSQLLTFSKGGAPVKKVVSLAQVLRHAAEFSLYGSNLRADFDLPSDLWKAEVDAGQIEQVVNALVLNAREAMPHGGTVRIVARNAQLPDKHGALLPAGRYLEVSVTDRGPGMPEELVTKIFDPYFTTKPRASGLGLAIGYSIVKKHGGLLLLDRTSPEGSTFSFYLPATNEKLSAPTNRRPNGIPRRDRRVLVMDDEAAIRDLTSQLLHTLGYQVTAVPDGMEAIKIYEGALRRGENYQAVILDATVRGGLGGVATIERLRNLDPEVNAIICSGYSDEAALSEFLAYGFRGALPKPFTRSELDDALKRTFAGAPNE